MHPRGPASSTTLHSLITPKYLEHNKGSGYIRLFSLCKTTANRLWILCCFTNKYFVYITRVQTLIYMCKCCIKCCSCECFYCLDHGFLNQEKILLKLRVHHSGKFAPRENNLLYSDWYLMLWKNSHIITLASYIAGYPSHYHESKFSLDLAMYLIKRCGQLLFFENFSMLKILN